MPPPDISTLLQDFGLWLSSGDTCGECLLEDRSACFLEVFAGSNIWKMLVFACALDIFVVSSGRPWCLLFLWRFMWVLVLGVRPNDLLNQNP